MNCLKCGNLVNENASFCSVCGSPLSQNQVNASNGYDYHIQFQSQNNDQGDNKVDLIDAYIGKNIDKIKSGKFSFTTFFFGALYVLYRKMWLLGLIWQICIIALSFLPTPIYYICTMALSVFFSIRFNEMYLNKVKQNVEKITSWNLDKSKEELKNICSKKGGTTIWPVIIVLIIYVSILLVGILDVLDATDDVKVSAAKSEASFIVSGVNNYCSAAELRAELTGGVDPCSDGVTIDEVYDMTVIGNATVKSIKYNGRVTNLTIKSNGITVTYDVTRTGDKYKVSK